MDEVTELENFNQKTLFISKMWDIIVRITLL